jgi:hypothetical protein
VARVCTVFAGVRQRARGIRWLSPLDGNGKGSIMFMSWDGTDFWNNCTATDLGFPERRRVSARRWRMERRYTRGCVIVNPTASTVAIGGETIFPPATRSFIKMSPRTASSFQRAGRPGKRDDEETNVMRVDCQRA